jgi:hypothetical protein
MPNYDLLHKPTGEITERFMTIATMEQFLKDNPDYEITFLKMNVGDPVLLGVKKIPSDFEHHVLAPIERHYFKKRRESKLSSSRQQV